MNFLFRLLIYGLLLQYPAKVLSQGADGIASSVSLKMLNLSIDDGLSQGSIVDMAQDHGGFLWISTADGLNRYDGYSFKVFKNTADSNSIAANSTGRIVVDEYDRIWVTVGGEGLDLYDREAGVFRHIIRPAVSKNDFSDFGKMDILSCKGPGVVFVNDHRIGLVQAPYQSLNTRLNKKTKQLSGIKTSIHWLTPASGSKHFIWNNSVALESQVGGRTWLIDGTSTLFELVTDTLKKQYSFVEYALPDHLVPPGKQKYCPPFLAADHERKLIYFQQYNNLYCLNEITGQIELLMTNIDISAFCPAAIDNNGNIWVASAGVLKMVNVSEKKTCTIKSDDPVLEKRKQGNSSTCFADRAGNLWIGSIGYGIFKISLRNTNFHHIKIDEPVSFSTQRIYHSPSGKIYIVSWAAGEYLFDTAQLKLVKSPLQLLNNQNNSYNGKKKVRILNFVPGKPVLSPLQLKEGNYFLRSWDYTNIGIVEPQNGFVTLLYTDTTDLAKNFLLMKNAKVWVQINKQKLRSIELATGSVADVGLPAEAGKFTNGTAEDSTGRLWYGTSKGIACYDPSNNTWKFFAADQHNLPKGDILNMCFFKWWPDLVWIGYEGKGFCSMNTITGKCNLYEEINKRINSVVYGILPDRFKNLWLSTNAGLVAFTPTQNLTRIYTYRDGLQSNEFNRNSSIRTFNNCLLFGGVNGINYFNPGAIVANDFDAEVGLTQMLLNNKEVVSWATQAGVEISEKDSVQHIILHHNQNLLTFSFASSDLTTPDQNLFSYTMEGIDQDWSLPSNRHEATYTYLPPGDYTFRVKGTNRDGVWGSKESVLYFTILPPWWQTWWFRVLLTAAICGMLYGIYRYRINQVLKLQAIRNKISADMHDEIGSTLSSISFYSQALLMQNADEKQKQVLEKIKTNAQHVQEGLSDIIWSVKADMDGTDNLFSRMRQTGQELLEPKAINFHFDYDEKLEHQNMDMDLRKNFYLVFKEALNNAAKYSDAQNVWVNIHKSAAATTMTVRDDGKGFDMETVRNGNGLGNMEQRALAMKGKLQIHSEKGKGSSITLVF